MSIEHTVWSLDEKKPLASTELKDEKELESWARAVISQFEDYVKVNKKIPFDVVQSVKQIDDYYTDVEPKGAYYLRYKLHDPEESKAN